MDGTAREIVEQTTGDPPPGPPRLTTAPEQRDVLFIDGEPVGTVGDLRFRYGLIEPAPEFSLRRLQEEHRAWAWHNFPASDARNSLLGVMEEAGELAHAHLKMVQGIHGVTAEVHRSKAKDAVGDIVVFLSDYCDRMDLDLQECVADTWAEVRTRDWKKYPKDGRTE